MLRDSDVTRAGDRSPFGPGKLRQGSSQPHPCPETGECSGLGCGTRDHTHPLGEIPSRGTSSTERCCSRSGAVSLKTAQTETTKVLQMNHCQQCSKSAPLSKGRDCLSQLFGSRSGEHHSCRRKEAQPCLLQTQLPPTPLQASVWPQIAASPKCVLMGKETPGAGAPCASFSPSPSLAALTRLWGCSPELRVPTQSEEQQLLGSM